MPLSYLVFLHRLHIPSPFPTYNSFPLHCVASSSMQTQPYERLNGLQRQRRGTEGGRTKREREGDEGEMKEGVRLSFSKGGICCVILSLPSLSSLTSFPFIPLIRCVLGVGYVTFLFSFTCCGRGKFQRLSPASLSLSLSPCYASKPFPSASGENLLQDLHCRVVGNFPNLVDLAVLPTQNSSFASTIVSLMTQCSLF